MQPAEAGSIALDRLTAHHGRGGGEGASVVVARGLDDENLEYFGSWDWVEGEGFRWSPDS